MQTYNQFSPTSFDCPGLGLNDRQSWLVAPVSQTRDSDALSRSNFRCFLSALGGESETVEVHRFHHWGPGWYEIILIQPDSPQHTTAEGLEKWLSIYPVLDEEDYSKEEYEEATEVWAQCYNVKDRLAYIRKHRLQFEFRDFQDMLACVRGKYFAGYPSDLLN